MAREFWFLGGFDYIPRGLVVRSVLDAGDLCKYLHMDFLSTHDVFHYSSICNLSYSSITPTTKTSYSLLTCSQYNWGRKRRQKCSGLCNDSCAFEARVSVERLAEIYRGTIAKFLKKELPDATATKSSSYPASEKVVVLPAFTSDGTLHKLLLRGKYMQKCAERRALLTLIHPLLLLAQELTGLQ